MQHPQLIPEQSQFVDLHFPAAGIDLSQAFMQQPNRPVAGGVYARSTPEGNNVRGYEAISLRVRGGSRGGLSQYIPATPVAGWLIQLLDVIVFTSALVVQAPPSGHPVAPPP